MIQIDLTAFAKVGAYMRTLRALGLVVLGILVGVGAMLTGNKAAAAQAMSESRLKAGGVFDSGGQWFEFFRDTKTNTCYLATMSHTSSANRQQEVTALTQTDQFSCVQ